MTDLFGTLDKFKSFPPDYDLNIRRFYSPNDDVHDAIKAVLSSATESLIVSMYGLDDPELVAIIIQKAQDPKIYVQVNLDKTQAAGRAEVPLVALLRACPNTRVAVGMSASHLINHVKMVVVDGLHTLTGSTNWSKGGEGDGHGHGQNNEASIIKSRVVAHEATTKLNADHLTMLAQEGLSSTIGRD